MEQSHRDSGSGKRLCEGPFRCVYRSGGPMHRNWEELEVLGKCS